MKKKTSSRSERPAFVRPDPPGRWLRLPDRSLSHRAPDGWVHAVDLPTARSEPDRSRQRCRFLDDAGRIADEPWSTEADVETLMHALVTEDPR